MKPITKDNWNGEVPQSYVDFMAQGEDLHKMLADETGAWMTESFSTWLEDNPEGWTK